MGRLAGLRLLLSDQVVQFHGCLACNLGVAVDVRSQMMGVTGHLLNA